MDYWKFLVDRGATMLVCKPCAATRLISEDGLPPGLTSGIEGVYFLTRPRRHA